MSRVTHLSNFRTDDLGTWLWDDLRIWDSDKLPNSSINSYFNWENQINRNGILLLCNRASWTLLTRGRRPEIVYWWKLIFRYLLDLQRYFHMLVSYWVGFLNWKGDHYKKNLKKINDGTKAVVKVLNDLICNFHMHHITCSAVTWFHLMSLDVPEW